MTPDGRSGPAAHWRTLVWTIGGLAAAAGLAAWRTEGNLRLLCVLATVAAGGALARLVSLRALEAPRRAVGGSGYEPPLDPRLRILHGLLLLLYILGVIVAVFAGAVRFGWVEARIEPGTEALLPALLGGYVLLLAAAAARRIAEHGGVLRTWATRLHGGLLFGYLLLLAALGTLVLGAPRAVPATHRDVVVLGLVGVLGVGTHLLLALRLPTTFDLVRVLFRRPERRAAQATPPIVYAAVAALSLTAVVGFLLWRFDLAQIQLVGDRRLALLVLLLPLGVGAFFGASFLAVWRESRRGLYRKRIPVSLRNDLLVYGTSSLLGLVFGTLLVLVAIGQVAAIGPWEGVNLLKDLVVATIVATAGPIGMLLHRRHRRVDGIESRLPDLLADLAENRRAGLTMVAALRAAAQADYGELSPDVRRMARLVAWGLPFNEALLLFAERVRSSLVRRSVSLIIEASRAGGSIADILRAAARDAQEIKDLEADRRIQMTTYLIVLYVVFFVFMVVVSVLDVKFVPEVLAANEAARTADAQGVEFIRVDQESLRFIYFNAAIVQAVGNGLVAGVLAEGRVGAGLRHVALMTIVAWLLFRLILPLV